MKILVPVDGSEYALEALRVAIDFVKTKGASIALISVVPFIGGMDDHEISPARRERHMESLQQRADGIIKQACEVIDAEQVTSSCAKQTVVSVSAGKRSLILPKPRRSISSSWVAVGSAPAHASSSAAWRPRWLKAVPARCIWSSCLPGNERYRE